MMTLSGYTTPGIGTHRTADRLGQHNSIANELTRTSASAKGQGIIRRLLPYGAALSLLVLLLTCFWGFSGAEAARVEPAGKGEVTITITTGDTLWSIAGHSGLSRDIRESVFLIQQRNGLKDSTLEPGQRLVIPEAS